jgi:hypothetical protein
MDNIKLNIPLKIKSEIDEAVRTITTLVQQGIWHSTVRQFNLTRTQNTLSTYIRSLITEKRHARAMWEPARCPLDKNILNRLTRLLPILPDLVTTIKKYTDEKYNNYTEKLTREDQSLLRATTNILRHKQTPKPIRKQDGS